MDFCGLSTENVQSQEEKPINALSQVSGKKKRFVRTIMGEEKKSVHTLDKTEKY
jgi:hypothetical protein